MKIEASRKSVSLAITRLHLRWKRPYISWRRWPETSRRAKRGLKRGLKDRSRTVLLMLDETIVTETPPLYSCYGPIGEQIRDADYTSSRGRDVSMSQGLCYNSLGESKGLS